VVLLAGEPGIGKTRTIAEVAETARAQGALVLWGRCYEGEAARSFGPFVEALGEYVRSTAPEVLRGDLGPYAAPLTRIVPLLGERLPDLPEPVALEPAEERVRLLDAVAQSLLALATRVPTVLVLDDLHWADPGTVALLRHVARFAPRAPLLVLGAYRDVEVAAHHPLAEALGTLPRETSYEQVALGGLDAAAIKELVDTVADREMPAAWVETLTRETSGNPFFLREVLLHLEEEGALGFADGSAPPGPESLRLPDTVRQVIAGRLARLPAATTDLLRVAAAFTGGIDFEVARRVAGLEERAALDALDAALGAQLLVAASGQAHAYDFTHALVRHTLYEGLSPARQVRLHRRIAEGMEVVYGDRAVEHAAEIARHYHRSAVLPGAERGMAYCLAAADRAEPAGALEEVAHVLAMALELLPADDARRGRLLARRGRALASTKRAGEAATIAVEAAELVAASEGRAAAAGYLSEVAAAIALAGAPQAAWAVARHGLTFAEGRRDQTWALLRAHDLNRLDAEDPEYPGIVVDTPERREIAQFSTAFERNQHLRQSSRITWMAALNIFESRQAVLETAPATLRWSSLEAQINWAGAYRDALPLMERLANASLERGELALAAVQLGWCSCVRTALGDLASAERDIVRFTEVAERAGKPPFVVGMRAFARFGIVYGRGTGLELLGSAAAAVPPGAAFWRAAWDAIMAVLFTFAGRDEDALRAVARAMPAVERAGGGVYTYTTLICRCCEALWRLGRADFADVLERNLRAKTLAGDFRDIGVDARLAMAQLCALTGRPGEAHEWFERARAVLDEQGARPLRAIVDYDEALMYARRGAPGDPERARPLLDAALAQFRTLGMPGWIRRAEALLKSSAADGAEAKAHSP
jgi:hypothetical protein